MQSFKPKPKITEKVPLKAKLVLKSTIFEPSQLFISKFSFEDSLLACGFSDGYLRTYNPNTNNKISEINTNTSKVNQPINSLKWRPNYHDLSSINSVLLVANTSGHLYQYIAKTGKEIYHSEEPNNFIYAIDYVNDGRAFATGGKSPLIRVYDEETKSIKNELKGLKWQTHGHSNRIQGIKFMPDDGNVLVSGGWDQNINIWDIREEKSVSTIFGAKIIGDAIDIRGNNVLTGSEAGNLEIWDWRMLQVCTKFQWDFSPSPESFHKSPLTPVFSCQFCHNSKETILACGSQRIKMFSLIDGKEMLEIKVEEEGSLYTCDSGFGGNKYFAGGRMGVLYYFVGVKSYE